MKQHAINVYQVVAVCIGVYFIALGCAIYGGVTGLVALCLVDALMASLLLFWRKNTTDETQRGRSYMLGHAVGLFAVCAAHFAAALQIVRFNEWWDMQGTDAVAPVAVYVAFSLIGIFMTANQNKTT